MEEKCHNNFFTQERWRLQEDQQSFTYQSEYCSKSGTNILKRWNCNHLTETSRSSTEVNTSSGASSDEKGWRKSTCKFMQLSKEVESQTGVTISRDTIWRTLQRNGMHGCRPRKKPLLKPRHKKAHLEFARAHADKDEDYWDSILWSDETKINVFGTDGFKTGWRRKVEEYKEKCMVPTVKHGGGSVLMWGCMSAAGVRELHFIDGIMNSQMYCSILKEKMLPSLRALSRRALFQHDNDPKHTSKATVGFLKKNRVKVIQWPSMSPDLNPIEHLWGILKRQVQHHSPSSIQSLKEVILEEWKKIDLAKCRQLVHSMPRRLGAVIKNHGGHTKY